MDRVKIAEAVARKMYGDYEKFYEYERKQTVRLLLDLLDAAGFFDLLEAAEKIVFLARESGNTCRVLCQECGQLFTEHGGNCPIGKLQEAIRKAGGEE